MPTFTEEQLKFKKIAKKSSLDYANSVETFAFCSKYFLSNHPDLFQLIILYNENRYNKALEDIQPK